MNRIAAIQILDCISLAGFWFLGAAAIAAEPSGSPLAPHEELTTFHFADSNLIADLVVSEPDVVERG